MPVRKSRELSFVTTMGLPPWSVGPSGEADVYDAAVAAGYEGIQVILPGMATQARNAGLARVSALFAARTPGEVDPAVAMWADGGATSLTLHVGTGFERRDEAAPLVEAVLAASAAHGVPVLFETHRGTLTQDPARTLELVDAYPELRFTADLSHWYTGVELVYGDFDAKVRALEPILSRCRMIHGRISDPGCIQVPVRADDTTPHVEHFRRLWGRVVAGCDAAGEQVLPFVVELLGSAQHYARTVEGDDGPTEEVDRWTQAEELWKIFDSIETP